MVFMTIRMLTLSIIVVFVITFIIIIIIATDYCLLIILLILQDTFTDMPNVINLRISFIITQRLNNLYEHYTLEICSLVIANIRHC